MANTRYTRVYPNQMRNNLRQHNLSQFTRAGVIDSVDPQRGTCTVRWLDRPGMRQDVLLTQGSHKEWHVPERNAVVLVEFDVKNQARIVRYINVGWARRSDELSIPDLQPGEKLWEAGGTFLYMQENGDLSVITENGTLWTIENDTGTIKSESVNWKIITNAGKVKFGLIKRLLQNQDGTKTLETITNDIGEELTELDIEIFETSPTANILDKEPIVKIVAGNVVDQDGNVQDKAGNTTLAKKLAKKDLVVSMTFKSGVKLKIDKAGVVNIDGKKLNINDAEVDIQDPDVGLGLDKQSTKGTLGQRSARQHDDVTVPVSMTYVDPNNTGLTKKSIDNILTFVDIASAILSPVGPCFLNPSILQGITKLNAEITSGSKSIFVGDGDE